MHISQSFPTILCLETPVVAILKFCIKINLTPIGLRNTRNQDTVHKMHISMKNRNKNMIIVMMMMLMMRQMNATIQNTLSYVIYNNIVLYIK
jgi:hypothetical protein